MYFCKKFGPVVQLYRTSDSGSEGRGLESRQGHKVLKINLFKIDFLKYQTTYDKVYLGMVTSKKLFKFY